jgi:hypothetical protein
MTDEIRIILKPASDDGQVISASYQAELSRFSGSMHDAGLSFSQRGMAFDAIDAHGYALGEFAIKTLAPTAITALVALGTVWIQARAGRKIRVKVGDVEAEAGTAKEMEAALRTAIEIKERLSSADEGKD